MSAAYVPTIEDLENKNGEILTCTEVAPLLQCSPATLHMQATQRPEMLGFPVVVIGNRVKIPKKPFVAFMRGELMQPNAEAAAK